MFSTAELLDRAKRVNGDVSDYRLAQLLGVPQSTISNYRSGRNLPDNTMAARLARLCSLDPVAVVIDLNSQRHSGDEEGGIWSEMRRRLRSMPDPDAELLAATPLVPLPGRGNLSDR